MIRRRKRHSNRAVLVGLGTVAVAFLASLWGLAPQLATTIAAVAGVVLMTYGVCVGWLVFYDRDPDGPPS